MLSLLKNTILLVEVTVITKWVKLLSISTKEIVRDLLIYSTSAYLDATINSILSINRNGNLILSIGEMDRDGILSLMFLIKEINLESLVLKLQPKPMALPAKLFDSIPKG